MTPYAASAAGPLLNSITLVDTTDTVTGGLSGNANVATKQLADNDAYLYKIKGGFENVVQLDNTGSVTSINITTGNLLRNLVVLFHSDNVALTANLPAASGMRDGDVACIKRLASGPRNVTKLAANAGAGDKIIDRYGNLLDYIYLHAGESVVMYKIAGSPGYWHILEFNGNLYNVGDVVSGYQVTRQGALMRNGQVVNRADYPRLWDFVNAQLGASTGLVVSDATWSSDPGSTGLYPYKSRFSTGNGTTTFRLPDDRGTFERMLSMSGAGRDADRISAGDDSIPGSLQNEALKSHTHGYITYASSGGPGLAYSTGYPSTSANSDPTGGTETRPVNVGRVPWIIY